MRRTGGNEAGIAFWFLVAAFMALMIGRARAEEAPVPAPAGAAAPAVAAPAPVDAAAKAFRGQVVFSDVLIAPAADFPSGDAMVGALQRLKRSNVQGTDGFWRMHMVAFPSPVPTSAALRLRATDTTDPKQRKQVKVFEITVEPGQPELQVADLVLTDVMGFQRGHRYEIAVIGGPDGEAAAGKGDVYAQGVITLM